MTLVPFWYLPLCWHFHQIFKWYWQLDFSKVCLIWSLDTLACLHESSQSDFQYIPTSKALDYLFLLGYAVGSGRVAIPIYTSEICQPEVRKYTGAFAMIFMLSGLLSAAILGKEHKPQVKIYKIKLVFNTHAMNFFVLDHPMYINALGLTLETSYSIPILKCLE